MKSLKHLVIALISVLGVACSSKEEAVGNAGGVLPPSKPLPSSCSQDLLARLSWRVDRLAFGYLIEVGTQAGVVSKSFAIAYTEKSFLLTLERGATYFLKVTKYLGDGNATAFQNIELYVPTCDERVEWQKAHPTYVEPFDHLVTWSR
ncbi:hypothetical protein [Bdellovibrio sp.]|uniref:hypothetical protein n=1 Tax=Bdellovibrio sp. TaxID=28201 RepID=UPI0039E48881